MLKRFLFVMVVAAVVTLAAGGCKTHPGSREFIPGKGWVPN